MPRSGHGCHLSTDRLFEKPSLTFLHVPRLDLRVRHAPQRVCKFVNLNEFNDRNTTLGIDRLGKPKKSCETHMCNVMVAS